MRNVIVGVFLSYLLSFPSLSQGQECFFLKNVLDTLYQASPVDGSLQANPLPTDYNGQQFYGYLATIDAIGRRYIYGTLLSPTDFSSYGLKIVDLDSMTVTTLPLSNFQRGALSPNYFFYNGLEYGAIQDQLYIASTQEDSLFKIDLQTGVLAPVQHIPNFSSPYAYLTTFHQSEERYAMIGLDSLGEKRFYQVDLDDDTTYVSPPMNFPEPIRALEVSEATGQYYVINDVDKMYYEVDPDSGLLRPLFPIPGLAGSFGYLHTFDFGANQHIFVGRDSSANDSLRLYSIFPATQTIIKQAFPLPALVFFGLEATNTQFLARMVQGTTSSLEGQVEAIPFTMYPNPAQSFLRLDWPQAPALQVELFDLSGKVLRKASFEARLFSHV
jgi:hypothetical protein